MASSSSQDAESPVPLVSFLGPLGSFTHQATLGAFKADKYDYKAVNTISDVFSAVQDGTSALGVVPIENSTNGAVIHTLDLFADRDNRCPDVNIVGEAYLDVSHFLLGHKTPAIYPPRLDENSPNTSGTATPTDEHPTPGRPRAHPLCSVAHIRRIYSHPQAFGQCEIFLDAFFKGVERIDVSSTSKAAEIVKNDTTGASAAIASVVAAKYQDLDILARSIEDRQDNTTRFYILRKGIDLDATISTKKTKTFLSFTVNHHQYGSLSLALECFRKANINLTSINNRPTRVRPFQYIFFVEFEGSRLNHQKGQVETVLKAVSKHVESWRWWGSWDDQFNEEKWKDIRDLSR